MSAEVLRRAAALMRGRAEPMCAAAPWIDRKGTVWIDRAHGIPIASGMGMLASAHIASWHPGVALAVADWLDTAGADLWAHGPLCECGSGCHDCDDDLWQPHVRRAVAVARAYLGDQP